MQGVNSLNALSLHHHNTEHYLPGVNIWRPRLHQVRKPDAKITGRYRQIRSNALVWWRLQHSEKQAHVLFTEFGTNLKNFMSSYTFLRNTSLLKSFQSKANKN